MTEVELTGPNSVESAAEQVVSDPAQPAEAVIVPPLEKPAGIAVSGFFNPTDCTRPYAVRLGRLLTEQGKETFQLEEPIGYWDQDLGAVIVPANLAHFRTDLTSVPNWFTWLVPRTGLHLPAALIHDGLVLAPGEPQTYIASTVIDRATADRLFRDAMRDLHTSGLRRWLIWSAVAAASMVYGPLSRTWRGWLALLTTLSTVLVLGTLSTIDLLDLRNTLPWMGERPAWLELSYGALAAVLIPPLTAPLWGRRWQAGAIAGIAAAYLLHVTLAIALVASLFNAVEAGLQRRARRALISTALAILIAAAVLIIGRVATG